MTATNFPEFNAAVTELTTKVSTLLGDVATMQSIANVQVAVDQAAAASTSAEQAATSASAAASSEASATTSKNASAASATKAGQWAENAENVTVETGKYSAKHHAIKSAASATSAASSATTATTKASEASTSATNAGSSATKASQWAENAENTAVETGKYSAKHHALKAAASATSASSSASTATTKAGEAATSATNAANSAATATTKASEASTSATNAAASASTATTKATEASTSATTAGVKATEASNSATSASTSSTKAGQWAENAENVAVETGKYSAKHHAIKAAASASAAAASQSSASTSAGTATTKAGEAATSATNAAASATSAGTSATTATTKASEAATSATNAATSATNAASSASSAQAHANNAAAVVTGGTATLLPAAGKIPLSDADGKIDLQWLGQDAAARIGMIAQQINHIGTPGAVGFGVGICPTLTAGFSALAGTYALGSDEYGNYRYQDGSIMVWVPAFYYRIGHVDAPNYARDGANAVEIRPLQAFADRAAAAAAGFALHRAFIDGGEIVPGFMYDKYRCSNNAGIASSIKNGAPLSSSSAHNPFSGLNGAPANNYGGAFAAAKTRGAQFFPASRFMRSALALLAMAHGQAANTAASCAWFDANRVINFPKGNNNNAFKDANDSSVTYTHDGYASGNSGLTGSGVPFAKTTHNGQACGIADLNGNMYTIEPGLTCVAASKSITAATQANPVALTVAGHGLATGAVVMITSVGGMTQINDRLFTVTVVDANTVTLDGVDGTAFSAYTSGGSLTSGQFYIAKEATRFKDFTGGASLATDHFGPTGVAAMMEPFAPAFRTDYPNNGFTQRFGAAAAQVLAPATAGAGWQLAGLGLPKALGSSTAGTSLFGSDYFYQYIRNELCLLSGAYWLHGSGAGPWTVFCNDTRTYSYAYVGLCLASYPVRPSGSEG